MNTVRNALSRLRQGDDTGTITLMVLLVIIALVGVLGLVNDGGGALRDRAHATDVAAQAARAGADVVLPVAGSQTSTQIDVNGAQAAAQNFLTAAGMTGTVQATTTQVTVTVTVTHQTTLLALVGVGSLTVSGTASSQPVTGLETVTAG